MGKPLSATTGPSGRRPARRPSGTGAARRPHYTDAPAGRASQPATRPAPGRREGAGGQAIDTARFGGRVVSAARPTDPSGWREEAAYAGHPGPLGGRRPRRRPAVPDVVPPQRHGGRRRRQPRPVPDAAAPGPRQ